MKLDKRILITVGLLGLLVAACSRHKGEFPTEVSFITSPRPATLTVATTDNINYTLTWTITDDSAVSFYRIYSLPSPLQEAVLIDSTTLMGAQINTVIPTQNIVWGVTSVSIENVESYITTGSAP